MCDLTRRGPPIRAVLTSALRAVQDADGVPWSTRVRSPRISAFGLSELSASMVQMDALAHPKEMIEIV